MADKPHGTVGELHELVLITDEAYYQVAVFRDLSEAERVCAEGNALLAVSFDHFEVRTLPVVADTGTWGVGDFREVLDDYIDGEDYFVHEHDWVRGECMRCGAEDPDYTEPEPVPVRMVEPSPFAVKGGAS